jgi:hypothetical protein
MAQFNLQIEAVRETSVNPRLVESNNFDLECGGKPPARIEGPGIVNGGAREMQFSGSFGWSLFD